MFCFRLEIAAKHTAPRALAYCRRRDEYLLYGAVITVGKKRGVPSLLLTAGQGASSRARNRSCQERCAMLRNIGHFMIGRKPPFQAIALDRSQVHGEENGVT